MSKLVACKACKKEIAKGVKKCPSCGKDQRNWLMRHKILSTIGFIFLISFVSILGSGGEETATVTNSDTEGAQTQTAAAPEKQETVYKIGDVLTIDQLEVTVSVFEELDTIGDPDFFGKKASDGGTFAAIQYTLKNVSDEPVGMFSYPTVSLLDEKGTEYSADIDASSSYAVETEIDNSKILSDLNPDISVTDTAVYEVSKEKFAQGEWFIQVGNEKIKLK
ncbi:DUF4352 domain-containing protein [Planococcus lenghuensis]|uniref:DUF4352 domain-containing protein n=1 Tax=Planococcus lenghuensis TaxID=2213202 RepID=A0A1Q2L113_9BACL|nr:DUF4352 domain-containing protein [Planococcus lenghuensis]AQQ54064.1 hypothetical protein B0X71_13780 [Planococcus lenghuensis]